MKNITITLAVALLITTIASVVDGLAGDQVPFKVGSDGSLLVHQYDGAFAKEIQWIPTGSSGVQVAHLGTSVFAGFSYAEAPEVLDQGGRQHSVAHYLQSLVGNDYAVQWVLASEVGGFETQRDRVFTRKLKS